MLRSKRKPKRPNWRKDYLLVGDRVLSPPPVDRSPGDVAWLDWIHRQPCIVGELSSDPCSDPPYQIEAAHQDEGKAKGKKTADTTCIPLCPRHHRLPGVSGLTPQQKNRLIHRLALELKRAQFIARDQWSPMKDSLPWR
jgi:hypothetical protein